MAHLQKTSFTTLGIFLDGFLVSPAVIPKLSVPPTKQCQSMSPSGYKTRTGKARRNKNLRKTTKTTNKWCSRNRPIVASNVSMVRIVSRIDEYANEYKQNNGDDLQRRKPILCEKFSDNTVVSILLCAH